MSDQLAAKPDVVSAAGASQSGVADQQSDVVSFQRASSAKLVAAIMYFVAGPVAAVFLCVLVSMLLVPWIMQFKVSDGPRVTVVLCLNGAIFLAVIWWSYRDYRRRAHVELIVGPSAVEFNFMGRRRHFTIDQIDGVRLGRAGTELIFDLRHGRGFTVPFDLVDGSEALVRIEPILISRLADRIEPDAKSGKPLLVRESRIGAIFQLCFSVLLLITAAFGVPSHFYGEAMKAITRAVRGIRQSIRAMHGGFEISTEGLRHLHGGPSVPWNQISDVRCDAAGIIVDVMVGQSLCASPRARHFCEARHYLLARASALKSGMANPGGFSTAMK